MTPVMASGEGSADSLDEGACRPSVICDVCSGTLTYCVSRRSADLQSAELTTCSICPCVVCVVTEV
jgi:hypothetical protein